MFKRAPKAEGTKQGEALESLRARMIRPRTQPQSGPAGPGWRHTLSLSEGASSIRLGAAKSHRHGYRARVKRAESA